MPGEDRNYFRGIKSQKIPSRRAETNGIVKRELQNAPRQRELTKGKFKTRQSKRIVKREMRCARQSEICLEKSKPGRTKLKTNAFMKT